ncbi:MAG: cold-shock protein [Bacteroidota bacterium]|jgi:cold shock protein
MKTGTVKFFNETKGFGFIKSNDDGKDIFVHVSGLKEEIRQDDEVVFEVQEGRKGPNAVNVRRA